MPVRFSFTQPEHKLWVLCHQTNNMLFKCEEQAFSKAGVSPQYVAVMMAIKHIKPPVTPTEVARWLDRSANSISMIVDRMERDGLVERKRDVKDRRSLRLVMTKQGEETFQQALGPGWELVTYVLSSLTGGEQQVLSGLLEKMREKAYHYLNPGVTMEEV
ncbi:MarR family winged helix-turn-helix transcriptional regulator [Chloroflexota bacterium]